MKLYDKPKLPKKIFKRIPNHHYDIKGKLRNRTIKSPTYVSWMSMIIRCYGKSVGKSVYYSGKVKVYEPWLDFMNFLNDMGERPENTTLGRFANTGNYVPGNCAWQTIKEQRIEHFKKYTNPWKLLNQNKYIKDGEQFCRISIEECQVIDISPTVE